MHRNSSIDAYICSECDEPTFNGVLCRMCYQKNHFNCAGITEAEYRKIPHKGNLWHCDKCKESSPDLLPLSSGVNELNLIEELRDFSERLESVECLKEEVPMQWKEMEKLKYFLMETNHKINKIKSKINEMVAMVNKVDIFGKQLNFIQAGLEKIVQDSKLSNQWMMLNAVEIKGVPQGTHENLFEVVSDIAAKIHYPIQKCQISAIVRAPTRDSSGIKPLTVWFCNRYTKDEFVAAARVVAKPAEASTVEYMGQDHQICVHLTEVKVLAHKTKITVEDIDIEFD